MTVAQYRSRKWTLRGVLAALMGRSTRFRVTLCLAVLAGGLLPGCEDPAVVVPADILVPWALLESSPAHQQGALLFARHCRECHGTSGEGRSANSRTFKPPAADFNHDRYASVDPAYLFWRIRDGKRVAPFYRQGSVMPVFGPHLSSEQIWQLVAYLRQRSMRGP